MQEKTITEQTTMESITEPPQEEEDEDKYLNSQIFVGALHPEVTQEEVENYFIKFGEIHEIRLMRDKITSKAFNFQKCNNFQENLEDLVLFLLKKSRPWRKYLT